MRAFIFALSLLLATSAVAFPTKPILLVVPFAPGGSNDIMARVIGEQMTKSLGQAVLVENQTGAAGSIGVGRVAKSDPDGHTLAVISVTFTINAVLQGKQPFDPITSFAPVALIARSPMVLAVANKHGVKTPAEFLALAKAKPGALNYGSAGSGSITQIGAELIRKAVGIDIKHVPYRGVPLALNDVIAGHVDMIVGSLPPMLEQIRGGKVTGIALMAKSRFPQMPEIATLDETIAPGLELYQWWAFLAPAGTPPDAIARLNQTINASLSSPEIIQVLAREGAEATPRTPEVLGELIRADIARWQQMVKDGSLQVGSGN